MKASIPLPPPFAITGSGCPNRWVLFVGVASQVTGFQTNNAKGVANLLELEFTLKNARDNSDTVFVEIYKNRFWEAEKQVDSILDPNAAVPRTIGNWAEMSHERRRTT